MLVWDVTCLDNLVLSSLLKNLKVYNWQRYPKLILSSIITPTRHLKGDLIKVFTGLETIML